MHARGGGCSRLTSANKADGVVSASVASFLPPQVGRKAAHDTVDAFRIVAGQRFAQHACRIAGSAGRVGQVKRDRFGGLQIVLHFEQAGAAAHLQQRRWRCAAGMDQVATVAARGHA